MELFKKAWNGEEKLWMVFWVYGIVGNIAVSIISAILGAILGMIMGPIAALFIPIIWVAFMMWYIVSVWRCAFNTDTPIWGYIARFVMALNALSIIGMLLSAVFLGTTIETPSSSIIIDGNTTTTEPSEEPATKENKEAAPAATDTPAENTPAPTTATPAENAPASPAAPTSAPPAAN